jgi:SH3-like domain-containing protein
MQKHHEHLVIATLVGLVLTSAAAMFVIPASAAGYSMETVGRVINVEEWDQLNVRKWPAAYSEKTGELFPNNTVWIERCIELDNASDWCKVEKGDTYGWVNGRYLEVINPEDLGDM